MNNTSKQKKQKMPMAQLVASWQPKLLAVAVASSMAMVSGLVSTPAQATDLEIYEGATAGKPRVVLMLDTSASMSRVDNPTDPSPHPNNGSCMGVPVEDPTPRYPFHRNYCIFDDSGKVYSRISQLKMGLYDLVTDTSLMNNVYIGIGHYPSGKGGTIDIPVKLLNETHKNNIIDYIKDMGAAGNTPIAQAYAEAGSYMLGTTTTPLYYKSNNLTEYSGFQKSSNDTKEGGYYNSPIPPVVKGEKVCAGNGIYFLTDGYANASNTTIARKIMTKALTPRGSNVPVLSLGDEKDPWGCYLTSHINNVSSSASICTSIFSQQLLDTNNPKKTKIITATVGFGGAFQGSTSTDDPADCNFSNEKINDTCLWGTRAKGGFYYAKTNSDVVNSVKSLYAKLQGNVEPVSTGSISVPLDSLGTFKSRKYAYLPILDPVPASNNLWNGNLKKYDVKNATLKGGNNEFVFKNEKGIFSKQTYDLWNSAKTIDEAKPQVGGTYQQVFQNNNNSRNLFVNNARQLTKLTVDSSNIPQNFDSLNSRYGDIQKTALLHFMGYKLPSGVTTVQDGTAVTAQDTSLKNIGGVLHSVPQLITTTVDLDDRGRFKKDTREDYILYGSMDGALHMVNDKDGKEVFTFIPQQIAELQPKALMGNNPANGGSYPYGVDGPWDIYASYNVDSSAKKYKADQVFAMGGLRMGGSTYYALNLSDINNPELIYSIGSNYSNKLQGSTEPLQGIKNDVTGNGNDEQKAYARMGQSWAKPTVGYVKSGGKRVMVNFLPGGYDTCYEDPKFKLKAGTDNYTGTDCSKKTFAQGNGMYMVQVGEIGKNSKGEEEVKTNQDNGKLLWWASNQGSGADSTSASSSLQYSKQSDLKHSIVTQVRALDRNYDGLTDHIYFSDLGGQVWRVDINNEDENNFKIDRVVKVLDVSDQVGGDDAPPRFYERPLVTFYNGSYNYTEKTGASGKASGVMALVTVGTGDRSSPVNAIRTKPDAVYSFIDKDITRKDLFKERSGSDKISLRTSGIKTSNLAQLTFTDADIGTSGIQAQMQSNDAQGWYMPFTNWLGEDYDSDGKYKLKMFNEPDALASILIVSSYDPDKGNTAGECSAGVKGQTQRERTCLPYGVCLDANNKAVLTARSQSAAGVGISDNFVTQVNDTSIFTSIKNRRDDDTKPKVVCPNGNCENIKVDPDCKDEPGKTCETFDTCEGPTCGTGSGVDTDQRMNPLSWMEH